MVLIFGLSYKFWSESVNVMSGVTKKFADNKVKEMPRHFFIVRPELWTTSRGWKIESKNIKEVEDITLTGNTPQKSLTSMVLLNEDNLFLVEGEWFNQSHEIVVYNWFFITPISRDYLHPVGSQKNRWFYPRGYIDIFDVQNKDYHMD